MNQLLTEPITEIIKQAVLDHPNTLFGREAFRIRVNNALGEAINQALANLVEQGIICNLDCSGKPQRGAYCLAKQHGGCPDKARQFFEQIRNITSKPSPIPA